MTFVCLPAYYEENICLNIIIIIVEYTLQSLYYTISYIRGTDINFCVILLVHLSHICGTNLKVLIKFLVY